MSLLSWWNLIFILPAFAAVFYIVLIAAGVVADDFSLDADGSFDLDGHDSSVDHVGSPDHPGSAWGLLSFFGVGRAPLSLLLISFGLLWGLFGMASNAVLAGLIAQPAVFVWISVVASFLIAAVLTRLMASGLGRVMPSTETYSVSNRQLVGRRAQVRYLVSDDGGTAQLYDQYGRLHEVSVRVQAGEPPIPAQTPVVIWRYDAAQNTFLVTPEQDNAVL